MRVETITHGNGEQLPLLVDQVGLPMPTPNEFIMGRRFLSTNTLVRNLRELAVFYRWLQQERIDLWSRIQGAQAFTEAEVRGGMVEALRREQQSDRKVKKIAVSPHTFNQRLTTLRQFLAWCYDMHISTMPLSDQRYERIREQQATLVKWLDTAFINSPPVNTKTRKGLVPKEIIFLEKILDPANPNALGRSQAVRFRNYISTMIMLYYGLRPGELLSLRVQDIEMGAISAIRVERRPSDPKDTRRPRPQIKRNGRILPIDNVLFAKYLDEYIMVWREKLEVNAEESEYLILSDEGEALSQSAITQFFQGLRKRFPDDLPQHLTAKALRHTFSSRMENVLRSYGLDEERRKQALAILRGDSSLQSQNIYIAQAIEENAKLALKNFHEGLLS